MGSWKATDTKISCYESLEACELVFGGLKHGACRPVGEVSQRLSKLLRRLIYVGHYVSRRVSDGRWPNRFL